MWTQLGLLQFPVWSHSVVLFNPGDQVGGERIEEYIGGGGQHLQRLMGMCGNRYCVLGRNGQALIAQILEEMEALAEGKRSSTSRVQHKRGGGEWRERAEGERLQLGMEKQTQRPTVLRTGEFTLSTHASHNTQFLTSFTQGSIQLFQRVELIKPLPSV